MKVLNDHYPGLAKLHNSIPFNHYLSFDNVQMTAVVTLFLVCTIMLSSIQMAIFATNNELDGMNRIFQFAYAQNSKIPSGSGNAGAITNATKSPGTISNGTSNTATGTGAGASKINTERDIQSLPPPSPPKPQLRPELLKIAHKTPVSILSLASRHSFNVKRSSIAIVVPVFTAAAYNDAFYTFYKHYQHAEVGQNITKNLYLLSSKLSSPKYRVISSVAASSSALPYLVKHLELLVPKINLSILTDIDVDSGSIFTNNLKTTNRYDTVILGHQEYVTQQEYDNLRTFVANGGTMLLLDGNVFYAQVGYDRPTQTITLIKGHQWAFNGRSAWKSVAERWSNETSQWVGSNSICSSCVIKFANNPFEYTHREEQYLTNTNDTILLNYNESLSALNPQTPKDVTFAHSYTIAAYALKYKKGLVIATGLYSDQIINNRSFLVFLDHLLFG